MRHNIFLSNAPTPKKLRRAFALLLILSISAEFFVHPHGAFGIDGGFGFHAWFALLSCLGLVSAAKLLGVLVRREAPQAAEKHDAL